jgi:hypothetical protein
VEASTETTPRTRRWLQVSNLLFALTGALVIGPIVVYLLTRFEDVFIGTALIPVGIISAILVRTFSDPVFDYRTQKAEQLEEET